MRSKPEYKSELISVEVGGCRGPILSKDICLDATITPKTVFYPLSPTNPLIDFLYQGDSNIFHAPFQVTLGAYHSAKTAAIEALIMRLTKNVTNGKVMLYYLVPSNTFDKFVTSPTNPMSLVRKDLQSKCDIFHLRVLDPNLKEM